MEKMLRWLHSPQCDCDEADSETGSRLMTAVSKCDEFLQEDIKIMAYQWQWVAGET